MSTPTFKPQSVLRFVLFFLVFPLGADAQRLKEKNVEQVTWFPYLGTYYNMYVGNRTPFTEVAVPGRGKDTLHARFLIDFGTDTSVVDLKGFPGYMLDASNDHRYGISIVNGYINTIYYNQYRNFQDLSGYSASGITESGILGTDILSQLLVTLDYKYSRVYLIWDTSRFGKPDTLIKYGFVPVSTKGFYRQFTGVGPNHNNDPTIPVVIGNKEDSAGALAIIDPGFDDGIHVINDFDHFYTHGININEKYFQHLKQKGVQIFIEKNRYATLNNIYNIPDTLFKCGFTKPYTFNAIGTSGEIVIPYSTDEINVYLKVNGKGGASAGGITTFDFPAAQFGGSILMDCDEIAFDPFRSLVWFRQHEQ
jgi:hypothetical protein